MIAVADTYLKSLSFHQGTTLLLAIHDEVNAMLWVANVGDSRGVMRSSGPEEVLPLSYDHKPNQVSQCLYALDPGGLKQSNLAASDISR